MKWADNLSQEIFEKRMNLLDVEGNCLSPYFPQTLPPYDKPIRFIDCGGYNGDTILELFRLEKEIEYIVTFEPHHIFVEDLKETIAKMPFKVIVHNKGVYFDNLQKVPFYLTSDDASRITDRSEYYIESVKLDDVIFNLKPNFIKMDIEGSEYRALVGAKKTIKTYMPRLAICLYHHPNDFIDIPLLLDSWDLDYRFYLRASVKNSLRLFAIP